MSSQPDGKIAYRQVGPLTEKTIKEKLLPLLKKASRRAA